MSDMANRDLIETILVHLARSIQSRSRPFFPGRDMVLVRVRAVSRSWRDWSLAAAQVYIKQETASSLAIAATHGCLDWAMEQDWMLPILSKRWATRCLQLVTVIKRFDIGARLVPKIGLRRIHCRLRDSAVLRGAPDHETLDWLIDQFKLNRGDLLSAGQPWLRSIYHHYHW